MPCAASRTRYGNLSTSSMDVQVSCLVAMGEAMYRESGPAAGVPPAATAPNYSAPSGRNPPALQPPHQPLQGYYQPHGVQPLASSSGGGPVAGNYVHSPPARSTVETLTRDFARFDTTSAHGAYSQPQPRTNPLVQDYVATARASTAAGIGLSSGPERQPSVSYGSPPPTASTLLTPGSSLDPQGANRSHPESKSSLPAAQGGLTSHKARLDPKDFFVRRPPGEFFVVGKVFIMLHTEAAGAHVNDHSSFGFSTVAFEELAYSQLRRFVVVRVKAQENYCLCVGAGKPGVDQKAHTIIYTGHRAPAKLDTEDRMRKSAIRVIPVRHDEKLDPKSRVNMGKMYTVEWNTKVKEIGQVDKQSMVTLINYWKQIINT
ncbi:MAG: hypothetical protein L6R39_005999 [Caloplaca ligustica]|nr:MAG: hypothetical protein L6R39_005999 [Caloplaca ligustica]